MIQLDVLRVMKQKAITKPYTFLTSHGFTHHTAYLLANRKLATISFRNLEKLCRCLHCEPHDLFSYTPDDKSLTPVNDHLAFLSKPDADLPDLNVIMKGLSPQQMVELTTEIAQRYRKAG